MYLEEVQRKEEILRVLKIEPDQHSTFKHLIMQKLEDIVRLRKREKGSPHLIAKLMEETKAKIHLVAPKKTVYDIETRGYPSIGTEDAPVTIVEFSDFQCPFCKQAAATLNHILDKYPQKVRLVFRNFPLPSHIDAQKAHEAAACAQDQGKFWEYHDILFANQNSLDVIHLKRYAAQLELEITHFNQCLDTGKYTDYVKNDVDQGKKLSVRGTPSFFINGKKQNIQNVDQFAWHVSGGKEGNPTLSNRRLASGNT